ncbi:MAG: Gfo/Idh/MocA family protein [Alphaproteobacteria bacterium]
MPHKILSISLGSIGKRHLRNARTLLPDAEIAVYRQHTRGDMAVPEGANLMFSNMDEALAFTPDAVLISSPASEHINNASEFTKRNIPMFIEKPLAANSKGIDAFLNTCRTSTGFIMVGYVLRFLPALHTIRSLINNNTLGKVHTARIEVGQYLPDWRPESDYRTGVSAQEKLGGGALLELSHEIDYATWLFGWPQSLQCSRAKLSGLEIDVEDSAHIIMEYADKNVAVQLDFLQRTANMAVQIVAEKGTLYADLIKEELTLVSPEYPLGKKLECEKLPNGNDIYLRQFDVLFHKSLKGYKPKYPQTSDFSEWASVQSAAHVLELVDLAKKASDTGTRQTVAFAKAKAA